MFTMHVKSKLKMRKLIFKWQRNFLTSHGKASTHNQVCLFLKMSFPVPTALLWKEAPLRPPRTHTPVPTPPAWPVSWAYPAMPWEWIQTPHPPPTPILPAPDSSRNISLLLPGESSRPPGARACPACEMPASVSELWVQDTHAWWD